MTSCPIQIGPQGTTPLPLPVVESSLGVEFPGGWKGHSGRVVGSAHWWRCSRGPAHWWRGLATSACRPSAADRPQTTDPQGPQSPPVSFYPLASGDELTFYEVSP